MTYKNMLLGKMKYLILFLIAIQSVLLALMAIFFTGVQYEEAWQSYNRNSRTVTVYLQRYLKNRRKVYTNTFWNKVTCLFGRNVLQIVVGMVQ